MSYSYDHDCPFEAFITNLGKYNEGELVGEWVKFPTTQEELQNVFSRIGIGSQDVFGNTYEEWFITDYDCYVDGLYEKLTYSRKRFEENFPEFIKKYGMTDMYSAGFYPFPSEEERWGYWSKHSYVNRIAPPALPLYQIWFQGARCVVDLWQCTFDVTDIL